MIYNSWFKNENITDENIDDECYAFKSEDSSAGFEAAARDFAMYDHGSAPPEDLTGDWSIVVQNERKERKTFDVFGGMKYVITKIQEVK